MKGVKRVSTTVSVAAGLGSGMTSSAITLETDTTKKRVRYIAIYEHSVSAGEEYQIQIEGTAGVHQEYTHKNSFLSTAAVGHSDRAKLVDYDPNKTIQVKVKNIGSGSTAAVIKFDVELIHVDE